MARTESGTVFGVPVTTEDGRFLDRVLGNAALHANLLSTLIFPALAKHRVLRKHSEPGQVGLMLLILAVGLLKRTEMPKNIAVLLTGKLYDGLQDDKGN